MGEIFDRLVVSAFFCGIFILLPLLAACLSKLISIFFMLGVYGGLTLAVFLLTFLVPDAGSAEGLPD